MIDSIDYISNLKLLYVNDYINSILKKVDQKSITNGKYRFIITLFFYNKELNISRKQAIDLIYNIAQNDEKIHELIRKKGGQNNGQL